MSQPCFTYPNSPQVDVVDDFHGTAVADPYRWLETPESDASQSWVAAQNELTQSYLAEISLRSQFEKRLTQLWNYPKFSPPLKRGDAYYMEQNDGLQNQPILYRLHQLDAELEAVIDPNQLSEDGTIAIIQTTFSKNGRYLAYTLSQNGSDWRTIHIHDLQTNQPLPEQIEWIKFGTTAWTPDERGFYYPRYPAIGEMPDAPPSTHQKLYYHRLGTTQAEDTLIYARPDAPDLAFDPLVTEDGRYLLLTGWQGTDRRTRIYYRDLQDDSGDMVRLLDNMDAAYHFLGNTGTLFYFQTDRDAPNGRVIAIDITQPDPAHWQELIPQEEDTIAFCTMVHNQFVVVRLHHAYHQLFVHALNGRLHRHIPLPTIGAIFALSGKRQDTELFIQFLSFLYPPTILRYDFTTETLHIFRQPQLDVDASEYETVQHFCRSKDGTQIPIFLTYKKGLARNGRQPTLLYGYGGFTVNMPPHFSPTRLAWIEQGGIYAHAILRGGNEYGEAWHAAGKLENKQNVFDDFISVAEWLIAEGYTSPPHLAIEGRSNGGLLVAACMTQRPELFGAVHCAVPVIDMLRYHRFSAGRYWTSEYGNAQENADHFRFMLAYSPLHNIHPGTTYPPTIITTADSDDRVVPMHAKKFTAALQTADSGQNPLLLRVETKAGHGMGKPTSKQIAEATDVYSFLWAHLQSHLSSPKIS